MFRAGMLAVLAILSIATAPIPSSPTGNPRPENSQSVGDDAGTHDQKTGHAPFTSVINQPTYYLQDRPKPEPKEPFYKQWDFWVASATLLLVAATIALAVPAWLEIKRNREAHERELRAYVMLGAQSLEHPLHFRKWRVRGTVRNYGKTPAKEVRLIHSAQVRKYPDDWSDWKEKGVIFGSDVSDLYGANGAIGALPWVRITFERPGDGHLIREIRAGQKAIYFFVEATYKDVFDKPRTTFQVLVCTRAGMLRRGAFESIHAKMT